MSEENGCAKKKPYVGLAASLAANIFFAAFILGHVVSPHGHPGDQGPGPAPQPPAAQQNGPLQRGGGPLFGPQALFTPEEMRAQEDVMRTNFEKVGALRKAFAEKLAAGPVTQEEAQAHFAAIDEVLDPVRKATQAKAAEKIAALSDEARAAFAQNLTLREERGPHGFGGRGQGMNGVGPMGGRGMNGPGPMGGSGMDMPPPPPAEGAQPPAPPPGEAPKAQ